MAVVEAAARGDAPRLAALLARAPHPNALDESGCSALQRAAADGHVEVLQLLLRHGANPDHQDVLHGNTAAHEAAWKGYSRCVALLAAAGADLTLTNHAGFAPLHLACQCGHNQSCRELLLAGAPPDLRNNYGDTSLHTAARYGHAGVTRILISAQSKISEQNKNGDTALHIAAAMGRRKLTRILLEAGCDKAIRNQQGETARDIATRKGLDEIISILNTPVAKQSKKKEKKRNKSKERTIDEPDEGKKPKDKKKKNVHFESPPVHWSPYGCHYYPDTKYFPKPKLSSLPNEPLRKGEQYYLDLAGNIKKGPIGTGYTCYCAPFFKHMEDKLNEDKKDLKRHIDRAHERLDQKVTDLEIRTKGQISELTRFVAAERALCKERHQHLEDWLTRGVVFRASERPKKLEFNHGGSFDIPPLKRTRSLELLDATAEEWNKVNRIIKSFNRNAEKYESNTKDVPDSRSKSTEMLDDVKLDTSRESYPLKTSKSSDFLNTSPRRSIRSPQRGVSYPTGPVRSTVSPHMQNIIAEIHVKPNKISVSQSPISVEAKETQERFASPSCRSQSKSPSSSNRLGSDCRVSDSDGDERLRKNVSMSPQKLPMWKSQVLQKTADDIRKRAMLENQGAEFKSRCDTNSCMDISQDGYVRLAKQVYFPQGEIIQSEINIDRAPMKSVQELVAKAEYETRISRSPEPLALPRKTTTPTELQTETQTQAQQIPISILKMPQQPSRPAPVLKEKPPKPKKFSLHNLIPFPTRKTFKETPPEDTGNNSESSDEEDNPIRSKMQPGPMKNANLLQTLPLPNYETMSTTSQSPEPQSQPGRNSYPSENRQIPKDAYFHDLPNRQTVHHQSPYRDTSDSGLPVAQYGPSPTRFEDYNQTGLPAQNVSRNRNPLYHQTGLFDAMMQDHITREMERMPHCYGDLDQNTEIEIANQNEHFRDNYYDNRPPGLPTYPDMRSERVGRKPMQADHNLLHSRLQSLAINTHLSDTQSQIDRESHNDSGYSTKVYGSSQGPSPSLSGHVENTDNLSGQRINVVPNGKFNNTKQIGASSLV